MKRQLLFLLLVVSSFAATGQIYTAMPEPAAARDGFGRWRTSEVAGVFDVQFTYDRQPLLFDTVTIGSGTSIAHDATNKTVDMFFSSTATGGRVMMQSFEYFRYQPGKSQLIFITFNFRGGKANVDKIAGYSDGNNGIELLLNDLVPEIRILSDTDEGDETITQANWSLDPMNGSGPSGITLDFTQAQILVIDFQALYVGTVRVGFSVAGDVHYAHEFNHSNNSIEPYFQTANLPIRVGMISSGTVTDTMSFICSSVMSEGGQEDTYAYLFSTASATVSVASETDTHILSIEPALTFNGVTNRTKFALESVDIVVIGANPVEWKLCIGQALTATTNANVNTTYSAVRTIAGTLSAAPAIVIARGYATATNQIKTAISAQVATRYPITLDHEGAVRDLGRMTVLCSGIGGASSVRAVYNWREVR